MSAHAAEIDRVVWLVHGLMAVLFTGWGAYFLYVLFRFRRGRQPRADHAGAKGKFALGVEIGVVVAEVVLLVVFALPLWFKRTSAQPADPSAITVRVVAEQFAWNVHYPGADGRFGTTAVSLVSPTNPVGLDRASQFGKDDLVVIGELHVVVNRPVIIQLSSKDMIHSFGVQAMRVKQDAVPGLFTPVWFTPIATGDFEIACSQLCGLAHYRMRGVIKVETEDVFRKYLADEAAAQGIK